MEPNNLSLGHHQHQAHKSIKPYTEQEEATMMANSENTPVEEPLSPAARLFHAPRFNCFVLAIMGLKEEIEVDVGKAGLQRSLLKHPRLSSILVVNRENKGGEMTWVRTRLNIDNHVIVPDINPNMDKPDQFVEDYISNLTNTSMDLSNPLWEVHFLNVKTSGANATGIFKLHHSLGDGESLMSLLLASARKSSDPEALPTIPRKKNQGRSSNFGGGFWWFFITIWWVLVLVWNTLVDLITFFSTTLFLKDTETPLRGGPGVELNPKRIVYRMVSLDDIKLVKNAMDMIINDVLLGITQAGLSRYLNRRYCDQIYKNNGAIDKSNNLPKNIRLRATVLVNTRPSANIEELANMMEKETKVKWGNWIGYILLPFTIALRDDPLDYVREAKCMIDRKKHSLEALCTFASVKAIVNSLGNKAAAAITRKVLFNTTMSFSNMVGPSEEISFCGNPIAPSVYGHPQSYVNKMTIVVAVDQAVLPDPHQLCDDLEESLKLVKIAVIEKGLIYNNDAPYSQSDSM